jgi:hypothetical protein
MRALQFRLADSPEFDFDDWLQAPPMIAHLVDPTGGPSGEAALRGYLRVAHTFDLHEIHRSKRTAATTVGGTLWRPVGERAGGDLADVQVPFTVEGVVERGAAGEITEVRFAEPEAAAVAEAASFVRSLSRHGEIGDSARERAPRAATHVIETDDHGRRRLLRKRFRTL